MNGKVAKMIKKLKGDESGKCLFNSLTHVQKGRVRTAYKAGLHPGVPFTSFVEMTKGSSVSR